MYVNGIIEIIHCHLFIEKNEGRKLVRTHNTETNEHIS